MVYRLDAGTVIDAEGNLVIENLYTGSVVQASQIQGVTTGYSSGSGSPSANIIDKFPFSSDANATDVGDLTQSRTSLAGSTSSSHGYSAGGVGSPFSQRLDTIDKFPLVATANASDVGDLTENRYSLAGQTSDANGYVSGGLEATTLVNFIENFPFSTDANSTDVGDLTQAREEHAGQSSSTHGYNSGGKAPTADNVIDKFPFSSNANATDVGDITVARGGPGGNSSSENGYSSGGYSAPPGASMQNIIDKFPFSSDANATDVGDLTVARNNISEGQNSSSNGYISGGFSPTIPGTANIIEKFPFGSDANATDVGDLTAVKSEAAGQQV